MNILHILAIFSIAFFVKESDGPFGIMNWFRNKLISNKYVGVFFYKLLDCYHCTGCWVGGIVYLISCHDFVWNDMILWFMAGGAICFIINSVLEKLLYEKT